MEELTALIGTGISIYGTLTASHEASKATAVSQRITGLEGEENSQRQEAMNLMYGRQKLEVYRNVQRARALALTRSVSQGAQFGSGLSGGQAQIEGQGAFETLGINQNQDIGNKIFGLDAQITQQKMLLSSIQGRQATDQGIASLGGALLKSAPAISDAYSWATSPRTG